MTPPGSQGLLHHQDQQMAVIVQIAGVKRWRLWHPMLPSPMRACVRACVRARNRERLRPVLVPDCRLGEGVHHLRAT
ncbi:cupin domain-containing protein [Streptomyces anulatus]|uniref:JmjC domain-containing protein n=1 Tax=Streptomyces anulatus TaxID=1892 RepID=UPI003444B028